MFFWNFTWSKRILRVKKWRSRIFQKNSHLGKKPKNSSKIGFYGFCQNFNPLTQGFSSTFWGGKSYPQIIPYLSKWRGSSLIYTLGYLRIYLRIFPFIYIYIYIYTSSNAKVCRKHILRLLWKMVESMSFLYNEHKGMGECSPQKVAISTEREKQVLVGESPQKICLFLLF